MPTTHLLYLHGFRSSPHSVKARQTLSALQRSHPDVVWWCPQLPPSPRDAIAMVSEGIAHWPHHTMAVAGSSLGGFYATWVAERTGCKAVLLNPAVDPARDLAATIGEQTQWHAPEESFFFKPEYVQELRDLVCGPLQWPDQYFCIVAKGDEVLSWREMHTRYRQCKLLLLNRGDHAISDYARHLPAVMAHLLGH